MRAREREAASRRQRLQEQVEQLGVRAEQLDRGAAALRKGLLPGDAADLPAEALRSFASGAAAARVRRASPTRFSTQRGMLGTRGRCVEFLNPRSSIDQSGCVVLQKTVLER